MRRKTQFLNMAVLLASALCAPFIGITVTQMIREQWLGLDVAYFAYPTATLLVTAVACVLPLAATVIYFRKEI